jgi:hypothetical protein
VFYGHKNVYFNDYAVSFTRQINPPLRNPPKVNTEKKKSSSSVYIQASSVSKNLSQDLTILLEITNPKKTNPLKALGVVCVENGASCATDTSGWAGVSNSSTLSPVSSGASASASAG